jgi:hypothetical protein
MSSGNPQAISIFSQLLPHGGTDLMGRGISDSVPVLSKKLKMAILPLYHSRPERFPDRLLNYH